MSTVLTISTVSTVQAVQCIARCYLHLWCYFFGLVNGNKSEFVLWHFVRRRLTEKYHCLWFLIFICSNRRYEISEVPPKVLCVVCLLIRGAKFSNSPDTFIPCANKVFFLSQKDCEHILTGKRDNPYRRAVSSKIVKSCKCALQVNSVKTR